MSAPLSNVLTLVSAASYKALSSSVVPLSAVATVTTHYANELFISPTGGWIEYHPRSLKEQAIAYIAAPVGISLAISLICRAVFKLSFSYDYLATCALFTTLGHAALSMYLNEASTYLGGPDFGMQEPDTRLVVDTLSAEAYSSPSTDQILATKIQLPEIFNRQWVVAEGCMQNAHEKTLARKQVQEAYNAAKGAAGEKAPIDRQVQADLKEAKAACTAAKKACDKQYLFLHETMFKEGLLQREGVPQDQIEFISSITKVLTFPRIVRNLLLELREDEMFRLRPVLFALFYCGSDVRDELFELLEKRATDQFPPYNDYRKVPHNTETFVFTRHASKATVNTLRSISKISDAEQAQVKEALKALIHMLQNREEYAEHLALLTHRSKIKECTTSDQWALNVYSLMFEISKAEQEDKSASS